jgi:hypothetical protein
MPRSYQIAHALCYTARMTEPRHTPTRPHYLRFAIVLAGLSGCTTSTTIPDSGPSVDASPTIDAYVSIDSGVVPDDCYVTPPSQPIGSWGDGACYTLDGGAWVACPQRCSGPDAGTF